MVWEVLANGIKVSHQQKKLKNKRWTYIFMNQDKIFGIPRSLAKVVSLGSLIFLLFFVLSSHSDCWFSVNCTPTNLIRPEMAIGGLAAFSLIAVLQVPVMPAIVAGVAIWVMFHFWL